MDPIRSSGKDQSWLLASVIGWLAKRSLLQNCTLQSPLPQNCYSSPRLVDAGIFSSLTLNKLVATALVPVYFN